jgi:hypothetical protein
MVTMLDHFDELISEAANALVPTCPEMNGERTSERLALKSYGVDLFSLQPEQMVVVSQPSFAKQVTEALESSGKKRSSPHPDYDRPQKKRRLTNTTNSQQIYPPKLIQLLDNLREAIEEAEAEYAS